MATTTNYNHFRSGLENRLSSSLSTYPLSSSSDLHMKHNFEYSWKLCLLPCYQLPFPGYSFARVCSRRKSTQNVLHCLRWLGKAMRQESCSPVKPRIVKPRLPLCLLRIPGAGDPLVLSEFGLKMFFFSAFHLVVSYSS